MASRISQAREDFLALQEDINKGLDAKVSIDVADLDVARSKLKNIRGDYDALVAAEAKIATFDAGRVRALDEAEKKLKRMKDEALGVSQATEKGTSGFEQWAASIGSATVALGLVKGAVTAVYDEFKRSYEMVVALEQELGLAGSKMAIFNTAKRELQSAVGGKLGGDFDASRRSALKMGIDPDASWEISKKLLGDKFSKDEIPGILRIKAGMDLAGQNGEGLVTELQKLKLEPKIKSADIDRLYKMGVDSKLVYAELARVLKTDVATATAKVKAGTVDTGIAIKAIEKVAGEKFGDLADMLGGTIPALLARIKSEA